MVTTRLSVPRHSISSLASGLGTAAATTQLGHTFLRERLPGGGKKEKRKTVEQIKVGLAGGWSEERKREEAAREGK